MAKKPDSQLIPTSEKKVVLTNKEAIGACVALLTVGTSIAALLRLGGDVDKLTVRVDGLYEEVHKIQVHNERLDAKIEYKENLLK